MTRTALRLVVLCMVISALFAYAAGKADAGSTSPKLAAGDAFPDLELSAPGTSAEYLGLPDQNAPFRLSEVDADILLVEISSYFCGPCRKAVPELNEIRDLTLGPDPIKVRLLSIGAGDSPSMAGDFIRELGVRYPLFPDEKLRLHAATGSVPAPHTFIIHIPKIPGLPLRLQEQKTGRLTESPGVFLENIRARLRGK